MRRKHEIVAGLMRFLCAVWATGLYASEARAYRPFDGSDAAVAEFRELELEASPVGYLRKGKEKYLLAPTLVGNYGFAHRWEAALEGQGEVSLNEAEERFRVIGTAAALNVVVRRGRLQGLTGPSFAIGNAVLLPTSDERSVGAAVSPILSLRSYYATVHLNASQVFARDHHFEWVASTIVEGPWNWIVIPATEVLFAGDYHSSMTSAERSILLAAIIPLGTGASLDGAIRFGRSEERSLEEIRAGFTWTWAPRVRGSRPSLQGQK